ncbi:MAG: hypothetical protein WCI74_01265 [Actinomycetes bacterium]
MLVNEDEAARKVFAVYVRPEGERGEINFYATEADATADVGPGMPPGIITHGDTYVEYIGDALLFAPSDWPLTGVNLDLLVQLEADDFEIFVALTPAESDALLVVMAASGQDDAEDALADMVDAEDAEELVDAPAGLVGESPCAVWMPDGTLYLFATGPDGGGLDLEFVEPRPDFDDEIGTDRGVICLCENDWVPLVGDPNAWVENEDYWVINVQPRIRDEDELFFGRYTADDKSLVVTRAGTDTDYADEHLQVVAEDVPGDFVALSALLTDAGWVVDPQGQAAADASLHPELSESPGWYPAEIDDGIEWICSLTRAVEG